MKSRAADSMAAWWLMVLAAWLTVLHRAVR